MGKTRIEWTRSEDGAPGYTWNPVTGWRQITDGCEHCYALTFAERWRNVPGHYFQRGFDLQLRPGKLAEPLGYPAGARVFAQAVHITHHWHGDVPNRLRRRFTWPLPNVWCGVSAETQKLAEVRTPALLHTPATVRFASCEPLLGELDLTGYLAHCEPDGAGLDWVILGGESGPDARPMNPAWAEGLVDQCRAARVAVHVKQLGTRWGRAHHDLEQFPAALQVRQWPTGQREAVSAA
jgi:protein gp37